MTFGKKLIEHQVIRLKLANMARHLEESQSFLDQIAYNIDRMTPK